MLSTLIYFAVDYVPEIREVSRPAEVTMEARRVSSMLMTSPGSHSFRSGGTEWEKNTSTLENIEAVGLASGYHVLDREKVENLTSYSSQGLNYSVFRNVTDIQNQYRIIFTFMPVIHTSESFIRTDPPEFPNITEPVSTNYTLAGNTVRYGDFTIGGVKYNFLVTSHGGVYDTVYRNRHSVSRWNFTGSPTFEVGQEMMLDGREFTIRGIQNTEDKSGSMVVLSRQFKVFGPAFDTTASIEKINRYAVLNESGTALEPVRLEVFAWQE
ncbi:MAG: hypothetical protein ABEK10_02330 [Candidatus Nanosalina sp.]